jgi:hypothetical protein
MKILEKEDEILILREQLETLKQELLCECELTNFYRQQLKDTEDELRSTNQELCNALMLDTVSLNSAKALAKTILKSEKSASESLAELLSAIYGSQVLPEELEQIGVNIAIVSQ